jgi:hypothetical protein
MKNGSEKITNCKLRGEWAEMCFMTCATEHGLSVSRPYGESTPFDFIVGDKGRLLRVQVKSTMRRYFNGYGCNIRASRPVVYSPDDFDFLAILVIPARAWYIIPAGVGAGKAQLFLSPGDPESKYARYKEAWDLLCTKPCAVHGTIQDMRACADDADAAWLKISGCGRFGFGAER